MATLSVTTSSDNNGTVFATVSGLEKPFIPDNYVSIGLSRDYISWGATSIYSSLGEIYPDSYGGTTVNFVVTNVGYGESTVYAYARSNDWKYYPAGQATFYISQGGGGQPGVRPPLFFWTYAGIENGAIQQGPYKISGMGFFLTAAEWNGLTNNINQVRQYKQIYTYPFTIVYSGMQVYASFWSEVINSIGEVTGIYLPNRASGESIYANDLNAAVNLINSIT